MAQSPSGSGSLTAISGTLPSDNDNDVDMYRVCITEPASFSAQTSGTIIDPQLFLFDSTGKGVEARDDIVAGVQRQSYLTPGNPFSPTAAGTYYLAIDRYNSEPLSVGGKIFPDFGDARAGQIVGPTGPGGASPVSGWTAEGDAANENGGTDYTIATAGTAFCLSFDGFFSPIDNDTVNSAKAGQTVPVKYRLVAANGTPVSDPSSFAGLTSQAAAGACAGQPSDAVETYSGNSGLQYLGDGNWQFNWKTPKSYEGQCRTMTMTLNDGSTHEASFLFK
ncbi:MAG: DVUA0089 family protein [Actinomycetota bacterium]|nr:DVUA0089 family protein [Actinomycetota bacterium]